MRALLLVLLLAPAALAQLSEAVDALVAPYAELAMFDGVILLARGDTVAHHGAYGLASVEHGVPMAPDARFRVASIAKAVTATAIGTHIEAGRLSLDTTLDAFAPTLPEAERITVRQLLGHCSGVPHLNDLDGYGVVMRGAVSLDSLVAWLSAQPLDFEPGTFYTYSNGGFALLGVLAGGEATPAALTPAASGTDWSGAFAWSPPFENTFTLARDGDGWVYAEDAGDATAAIPLADGSLLLPMYDARCTLAAPSADLTCAAPWTGNALVLTRR